jgi:hypothetical protein
MIIYKSDVTPSLNKVINLYNRASLKRHDDERRMELMLKNANIKISAWDIEQNNIVVRGGECI